MDKVEFGRRLRLFRKKKGYSQYRLAEMMGYKDHSTLAKVETGVNDITIETLYRYAELLGVSVADLLREEEKRKATGFCMVFVVEAKGIRVTIRKIEKEDYPTVASLWRDVLGVPTTDVDLAETYAKMEDDGRYLTLIAEVDKELAGLVTMVFSYAIGHPDGYAKVNGLGVFEKFRGKGIGRALLESAEQIALDRGAHYVGLASGFSREDAHAFYEHLGYRKTSYWLGKKLASKGR